jgi:hypothetical protein
LNEMFVSSPVIGLIGGVSISKWFVSSPVIGWNGGVSSAAGWGGRGFGRSAIVLKKGVQIKIFVYNQ